MRQDHLISATQLSRADVEAVLDRAAEIDADPAAWQGRHSGSILGLCFFEPSTRTRMSFDAAMKRLGGRTIDVGAVESSSVTKGETLADTMRVLEGYADALVLRHPSEGAATMAAEFVDVPLMNAGDGAGQHPTQTLLDLYTIRENAGLDDITVGIMGDLKYGRTVHSLAAALTNFDVRQQFISPESLQLPRSVRYDLHESGGTGRPLCHPDPARAVPRRERVSEGSRTVPDRHRRPAGRERLADRPPPVAARRRDRSGGRRHRAREILRTGAQRRPDPNGAVGYAPRRREQG
jgi:aspartate carbamoyltransferase catalytic subunit